MNDQTQPKSQDAILGGQAPPTGAVLGGLDGIKQRLASGTWHQQTTAVTKALQYGEVGIDLLLQALKQNKASQVRLAAYFALVHKSEPEIKNIVTQHCPYRSFQNLLTVEGNCIFAISSDSQRLITHSKAQDATLRVWDLKTRTLLHSFEGSQGEPRPQVMSVSPDGRNCFVGHRGLGTNERIYIKELSTGRIIETLLGKSQVTSSIAISQDGQSITIGTRDGWVETWDLETKRSQSFRHDRGEVLIVKFSPDGQHLITGSWKSIKVWWRDTGELLHTLSWEEENWNAAIAVHISPDGKIITTVSALCAIRQWSLETGELLFSVTLRGTSPQLSTASGFSPDGQILLTTDGSGEIEFWNWRVGELLHSMQAISRSHFGAAIFSPDGQLAVTGINDGAIQVWGLPSEGEGL
jgi:hypothetical protein